MTDASPLLLMTGIGKSFPGVRALDDVQLDVHAGEVHALVGENGAGKSTLMHILAGVHRPDAGRIDFAGREHAAIADERAAQEMGIAIVYQERSLFEPLTVAENIFAGRQPVRLFTWIDRRRMEADARALLARVELNVSPAAQLSTLSPAQQQLVEIAKALSLDARLIIFDEPTAALTAAETQTLFAVIRGLQRRGTAVIYISHRLEEIFAIADRVTVLKDGRWQGTLPIAEATPESLIRRMVGRQVAGTLRLPSAARQSTAPLLEVQNVSDPPAAGGVALRDITFRIHAGEIVALAGLADAGRSELALSLFGARPFGAGQVRIAGRPVALRHVWQAITAGIGYLPPDRKQAGLFLDMSIALNIGAAGLARFGSVLTNSRKLVATAEQYGRRLGIACRGIHQSVRSLSGGNQQKVLLAKWLLVEPRVLIVDEPTRGVDVGAKAEVHKLLVELAERGTAVLVISSDLPEVLALADRVIVMSHGRIAGELSRGEASEEAVMRLAAGASPSSTWKEPG